MVGSFDLAHLVDDEVRGAVGLDLSTRLAFIEAERDYAFPYAQHLHEQLERLLRAGQGRTRPPCRRIVARSGMGKSFILQQFERRHPRVISKRKGTQWPVLLVEVPPRPTPDALVHAILSKLGAPIPSKKRVALQYHALNLLRDAGICLLIFDELNRIRHLNDDIAGETCELMRWYSSVLGVPGVVSGGPAYVHIFQGDEQLGDRYLPIEIPTFVVDEIFLRVVSTVLAHIPMREPPDEEIFTEEGASLILKAGGVTTAKVVHFLKDQAMRCLEEHREKMMLRDLKVPL